jgi:RNA polymerase sigma-B factor
MLFSRWHTQRDYRAREALVKRFLPLARQLALRYARASEPLDDLMQVATVGLLGAIDRFDPARGRAFTSFAVPTILGELKRHFRDHCWSLHVPRPEQELALRVRDGERELTATLGRTPSVRQLAAHLKLRASEVSDGLRVTDANKGVSLDAPVGDVSEPARLGDTVGVVDDGYELVDASLSLASALRQLPKRQRNLLLLRFGQEMTQREIGERIGVSQMQVSRLLRAALSTLHELAGTAAAQPESAGRRRGGPAHSVVSGRPVGHRREFAGSRGHACPVR